jgi:hypothetical protein
MAVVLMLVALDSIVFIAAIAGIVVGATGERRLPTFGLAVALLDCGLIWLTLRAAKAVPPRS